MTEIYYQYYSSPVGRLLMIAQEDNLTNLDFEEEQAEPNPDWILNEHLPLFAQVVAALERYFQGEAEDFAHIPLNPQGTPFQRSIWQALRNIPFGQTSSYGALATAIENPRAVRAVGGAVGSNPISIIIPCHRILGKQRQLTGFGGGLAVKRYLLRLERIPYVDKGVEHVKPKLLKKYKS